jgi:hypothetical protein
VKASRFGKAKKGTKGKAHSAVTRFKQVRNTIRSPDALTKTFDAAWPAADIKQRVTTKRLVGSTMS